MAAPAELASVNVSRWSAVQRQASWASRDLFCYAAFVRGYEANWHHRVMAERFLHGSRFEAFLGPPNAAKTEWMVMFAEWTLGRDPNFRWLVVSEVQAGQATAITTEIRGTIETNEKYQLVFGDLRGGAPEVWTTQRLRLRGYVSLEMARRHNLEPSPRPPFPWLSPRGRRAGLTHDNVRACGWRSVPPGIRADGLVLDDLVSDRSAKSVRQTDAQWDALHQRILPRSAGPHFRVFVLGQCFAPQDTYSRIVRNGVTVFDNNPDLSGMQALTEWGEGDER
jgi:hypothetical protein